ncbi:NfeD family protein [Chromobacterium paludis]|uniref:NfeD family protein n=1 Tax=Chromobacterium paludis TaxID=2605945 RepID=A0A5C1DGI5_9NEIS|nr:NfeD family protein [Chromobacterium paludis]QEL55663.1 NfeD family protein [Chromobacterium paludis]
MLQALTFWLGSALVALILEFMSGTFYLLVVAVAMACGGLAAWLGAPELWQWLIASLSGVIGVTLVRQRRRRLAKPSQPQDDPDWGRQVEILAPTSPGHARIHYRGAEWDAELLDPALQAGDCGYIAGRAGNLFKIASKQPE